MSHLAKPFSVSHVAARQNILPTLTNDVYQFTARFAGTQPPPGPNGQRIGGMDFNHPGVLSMRNYQTGDPSPLDVVSKRHNVILPRVSTYLFLRNSSVTPTASKKSQVKEVRNYIEIMVSHLDSCRRNCRSTILILSREYGTPKPKFPSTKRMQEPQHGLHLRPHRPPSFQHHNDLSLVSSAPLLKALR